MKFFDSHCHLQDNRIISSLETIMDRAYEAGVCAMLCCGSSEQDWDRVAMIYQKFKSVIPAFGIHPWHVSECSEEWLNKLEYILKSVPQAAVGEIGLDHTIKKRNDKKQLDVFIEQLRLARKLKRPVSIHCRSAWGDLLEALKKEKGVDCGGVIHSYSGAPQLISQLQKYGLSISFSGSVTWDNNCRAKESLLKVDTDRLLVETDSPDIAPQGHAGFNEPANLIYIVEKISSILDRSVESITEITYNNGVKLFKR